MKDKRTMFQLMREWYDNTTFIPDIIWYYLDSKYREAVNVSKFIKEQLDEAILHQIVAENGWWDYEDDDDKVIAILAWVRTNITWTSDPTQYKKVEYWATVVETLTSMKGDCEDGMLLIYALCRVAGVPKDKIKCSAMDVDNLKGGIGGHAVTKYKSDIYPTVHFFLDWCYYPDPRPISMRSAYLMEKKNIRPYGPYYKFWFLADEDQGYRLR